MPVAFAGLRRCVGMVIERAVLRLLYGRPLETLLATWGISLVLIQTIRLIFGAQNVAVANPDWLSGGYELDAAGWCCRTAASASSASSSLVAGRRLVPAAADPPRSAGARGDAEPRAWRAAWAFAPRASTRWTFGLGSGIAGLGGVALSQLGNVGPELGQSYIVDSFMVVVLGGVGKLARHRRGGAGPGRRSTSSSSRSRARCSARSSCSCSSSCSSSGGPQGLFALKGRGGGLSMLDRDLA